MRTTTLCPELCAASIDKSPAIPAANDNVVSASATARTRREVENVKAGHG